MLSVKSVPALVSVLGRNDNDPSDHQVAHFTP